MQVKASIFAAPPPPIGGVASIVAMLRQDFLDRDDVHFASPAVKSKGFLVTIIRPFRNIVRLKKAITHTKKDGKILFFSSAGKSFFEKLIWSVFIMLLDRNPVILMVDGNFPCFWLKCSTLSQKITTRIICQPRFVLGVQSEAWKDYYRSIFPSVSINVVGATVAQDFLEHTPALKNTSRCFTVLYVGWIIPEKGILDLLDALVVLRDTHADIKLRLVGPLFGREEYWNNAVVDRGISKQVQFIGPVIDRARLIREFETSDVFAFPSHFEGFPVALLEAIAMGLACVGTSIGGIPDILDHGRAGILVPPQSPVELANALKLLRDDPIKMGMLSKNALVRARSVYGRSECIESYKILLGLK